MPYVTFADKMTTRREEGVKSSLDASDTMHPGPNFWSDRKSDVWVDDEGRLHLKIVKRHGKWYCTEVTCDKIFGYGAYVFSHGTAWEIVHTCICKEPIACSIADTRYFLSPP